MYLCHYLKDGQRPAHNLVELGLVFYLSFYFISKDDLMGIHLKVKEEVERKKQEEVKSSNESKTDEELLPITDDMILSSCMQFFFDGVASVSSMISVAIHALAKDPDLQEKAFEEIQV